jgi:ABC-2 type transport system ATP-binding protein
MSAIVMGGLARRFGTKRVLESVTARAEAGRIVALLGRNGAGKTTLFKILLDLLEADSGSAEVLGRRPDGSGTIRRFVGYVPERPAFHGFMTAADVLDLRARFIPEFDRARAREMAARLGLDLSERVAGASKGTLAKLAWVCASAHEPEAYLLDEPMSGLDALVRDDVLAHFITELQGRGRTVLLASHHLEELAGLIDDVWVLAGGRIAAVYEAQALRSQARRITGRLKEGAALPAELPLLAIGDGQPAGEWAAFEKGLADMVAASGLFETLEMRPMALPETLKLLLKHKGGDLR